MDMTQATKDHYDNFYSKGGWSYSNWREKRFLKSKIVKPLKLQKGSRLLELGCGMGYQSNLFYELGFDVVGVDLSESGIAYAKSHFSGPRYFNIDATELSAHFDYESFDIIYIRGMSWYHYELNGVNKLGVDVPERTEELFRFLRPKGVFVLQIVTDFSGSQPEGKVHNNRFDEYVRLFERFGEVFYISDWKGRVLRNQAEAEKVGKHIIIATRKK